MTQITESTTNIISHGTRIEGKVTFSDVSRVHGTVHGTVDAIPGSTLVLSESAVVEGDVRADTVTIDGFVRGDVSAKTRVVVSGTGRVIGNIRTPSLIVEFGAYFEGKCTMEPTETTGSAPSPETPSPA